MFTTIVKRLMELTPRYVVVSDRIDVFFCIEDIIVSIKLLEVEIHSFDIWQLKMKLQIMVKCLLILNYAIQQGYSIR